MAPLKFLSFIVLTSLLFMSPSCCSAEHDGMKVPSPLNSQKAKPSSIKIPKVTLCIMKHCPYCQAFIKNDLLKLFLEDLVHIVNLRLVPWGNARVLEPSKTIICQHGPDECYLNNIEACANNIWPDVVKSALFLNVQEHISQPVAALLASFLF